MVSHAGVLLFLSFVLGFTGPPASVDDVRISVRARYDNGAPAAGLRVTVRERWMDGLTPRTTDYEVGTLDTQGRLTAARVRARRTVTTRQCSGFPPRCRDVTNELQTDLPMLAVMIRHPNNNTFFSRDVLSLYGSPAEVDVELPANFSSGLLNPQAVRHFMRRKNLNVDFNEADQTALAGLVLVELTPERIAQHAEQVDHLGYLFSDHRTYIYELEKRLLDNGNERFVPLPIWEPLNTLPPGWNRVAPAPGLNIPFLPSTNLVRPQLPNRLRPERICTEGFDSSMDVALHFGRTFASAPGSYHALSHAFLGGPFLFMSTAAAGVVFWPYHALLVEVYEKWLSCKFGRTTEIIATQYGPRESSRMALFRIGLDGRAWHSWERTMVARHNDADYTTHAEFPVAFDHWSDWERIDNSRGITRISAVSNAQGHLLLLGVDANNRLFTMQGRNAGYGGWRDLGVQVRNFAAVLGRDDRVEIIAVRPTQTGHELITSTEATVGQGDFRPFVARGAISAGAGFEVLLDDGLPVLFFADSNQRLQRMQRRADGSWNTPVMMYDRPVRQIQAAAGPDGTLHVLTIRADDDGVWHSVRQMVQQDRRVTMAWSGWNRVGSAQFNAIRIAQRQDRSIELVGLHVGGTVRRSNQVAGGGWTAWAELPFQHLIARHDTGSGQRVSQLVGVVRDRKNQMRVYVLGRDGFIYMAEERPDRGDWIGWTSM